MKYLFFDYDGTLAHGGVISEKNKEYLAKARAAGHKIFLNTGRSKANMPSHVLAEIPFDGIICGGGYMEYEGRVLFEEHIPLPMLEGSLRYAKEADRYILYEGVENVYCNRPDDGELDIYECLPLGEHLRITNITVEGSLADADKAMFCDCKICECSSYFELMPKGIDKATGLRFMEEQLGVPYEDIIVFGDSENDLEMLRYAKTSVIMNHAPAELSPYADLRTDSDENGVAEGIEKLLF